MKLQLNSPLHPMLMALADLSASSGTGPRRPPGPPSAWPPSCAVSVCGWRTGSRRRPCCWLRRLWPSLRARSSSQRPEVALSQTHPRCNLLTLPQGVNHVAVHSVIVCLIFCRHNSVVNLFVALVCLFLSFLSFVCRSLGRGNPLSQVLGSQVIYCLSKLGVTDALATGPKTAEELASQLGAPCLSHTLMPSKCIGEQLSRASLRLSQRG